jgi:Zn-dependent M28 family amino/carboxypeptidase
MDETDWIGETFTSDAGWSHLETLVNIGNRMAGSEGERRAAAATWDALGEYARGARLDEFEVQGWERGDSELRAGGETVGTTAQEVIALPRTPAGEAMGELVDLGHGLPEDFEEADLEGAVAMARSDVPEWYDRYLHRREKYYHAVEAGAAAFLYRNHVEGCLPPTGSVGTEEAPVGEIPAVGVSGETGARLARRFEGEELAVAVDCATPAATSQNVHAALGPDTDREVLVTAHVDAHDIAEGAMDNGAGTALVVELARALAAREAELDTRIHFAVFGAEEVGLVGSGQEAARREPDLESVKAVLNFDGVVRGRTLSLYTHGFDALKAAAERVADRFDHPIETTPEQGPHSDHWPFVRRGVPGYQVGSVTEGSGRGWGHTAADTLEKLAVRDLREQAVLATELAVELAATETELSHKAESEIADRLVEEGLAEGMKVTGDWPY